MALGSDVKKQQLRPEELEELLEGLEKLLDRTKVLYEQYFMGIQKTAPMQLHRDIERKVRELTQQQIRNTALRFRFTTVSQKFGSYNTYWKRTLREIEQGKYVRDLARVKRKAEQAGEELPEELLVKLPKRMQDRIRRDRARLAERATEREAEARAFEAIARAAEIPVASTAQHVISEEEADSLFQAGDLDIDGLFDALTEKPDPPAEADAAAAGKQRVRGQPTTASTLVAAAEPTSDEPAEVPSSQRPSESRIPARPEEPRWGPDDASPSDADAGLPRTIAVAIPKAAPRSRPIPVIDGFRVPPPPGMSRAGTAPPREDTPGQPSSTSVKAPTVVTRPVPPPIPPAGARPAPPRPPTMPGARPPAPARPVVSPVAAKPPGPPPPPGMDDKQCRDLYSRYLKARQLVGEKNDDVTYEKLVSSLGKQAAAIMNQHNARGVEFNVVVRGDKVVLKAKPIKPDDAAEPGPGERPGSKSEK